MTRPLRSPILGRAQRPAGWLTGRQAHRDVQSESWERAQRDTVMGKKDKVGREEKKKPKMSKKERREAKRTKKTGR